MTTKDRMGTFKATLEMFTPRLLKLYCAGKGAFSREMETLLDMLDKQVVILNIAFSSVCPLIFKPLLKKELPSWHSALLM